uniref:Transthyretin-like family protein n=1 Tax=Panagrellus redivivus TaxID=6233 RepID=A0A7E4WCV0_PANRE
MKYLFAAFVAIVGLVASVQGTVDAGITTRSVEATGKLRCGLQPARQVIVTLKRENDDDLDNVIGKTVTDEEGRFTIKGDTERFGGAKSTIDPTLSFYHKCDTEEAKPFNTFFLRFPRTYTTIGRVPRRQYDIGTLNLQFKYPKQTTEKNPPK